MLSTPLKMSESSDGRITSLLQSMSNDTVAVHETVLPLVYERLKQLARHQLKRSGDGHTLNTTALVHEAWMKISRSGQWVDSGHFYAVATRAMRQVIVDFGRARLAQRRGSGQRPLTLDQTSVSVEDQAEQLIALEQGLNALASHDERLVRLIECRFFAGLSEPETARALDVSVTTVQRDWTRARAWFALHSQ